MAAEQNFDVSWALQNGSNFSDKLFFLVKVVLDFDEKEKLRLLLLQKLLEAIEISHWGHLLFDTLDRVKQLVIIASIAGPDLLHNFTRQWAVVLVQAHMQNTKMKAFALLDLVG